MATKKKEKITTGGVTVLAENEHKDPEAKGEPTPEEIAEIDARIAKIGKEDEEWEDIEVDENYSNMNITTYAHHGAMVQVRRDLKGKHREYSLCHRCEHFKPDTLNNCHIAQAIFDNCVKFHVTTPVWECPSFRFVK